MGAKAVDYRGVGTIEFLVDNDLNFYFMEMNTRIQVEHPITEESYEVDLIQNQIKVAMGEKIEFEQEKIIPKWASIECRINAEDVEKDFRPTPGQITAIHIPGGPGVRIDKAVYAGYTIPPFYDSMIAKLIVRARTRGEAIAKMLHCLDEFIIEGIPTTIDFHKLILTHPDFIAGKYDTSFVEKHFKDVAEQKAAAQKAEEEAAGGEKTETAGETVAVSESAAEEDKQ
jgi:acetyl-CoA carboxylase biotin carboxylase subunit